MIDTSSYYVGAMMRAAEFQGSEEDVSDLEDFGSAPCCIPGVKGNALDLEEEEDDDDEEEEVSSEHCGRESGSGYRVGERGRFSCLGERANGGLPPSSGLKGGKEILRYRTGGSNPGTPQVNTHGLTGNLNLIQYAVNRYLEFREHRQFIAWETLSDTADSTYEEYATGHPQVRGQKKDTLSTCACPCGGQFFTPDQHEWEDDYRL